MAANEHETRTAGRAKRDAAGDLVHGSAVAWGSRGILILGPSGSGKSGLALRLMALGAVLVADDRVALRRDGNAVLAAPPQPIAGLVEARGIGILRVPFRAEAAITLVVDLSECPEGRLPKKRTSALLGREVPLLAGRDVPNLDAIITVLAQTDGVLI